jgi:hypothetical protein
VEPKVEMTVEIRTRIKQLNRLASDKAFSDHTANSCKPFTISFQMQNEFSRIKLVHVNQQIGAKVLDCLKLLEFQLVEVKQNQADKESRVVISIVFVFDQQAKVIKQWIKPPQTRRTLLNRDLAKQKDYLELDRNLHILVVERIEELDLMEFDVGWLIVVKPRCSVSTR